MNKFKGTYRGWEINLKPIKQSADGNWLLELERGDYVAHWQISKNKTLAEISNIACDEIDKEIKREINL